MMAEDDVEDMGQEVSHLLAETVERLTELYPALNVAPVTHRFAVEDKDVYVVVSIDDGADTDGAQLSEVDRMTGLLCVDLPFRAVLTWRPLGRSRVHGEYTQPDYWRDTFTGSMDAAYSLWAWCREFEFIAGASEAMRPLYCRRLLPDDRDFLDQEDVSKDLHIIRWEIGWITPVQISPRWQWRATGDFQGPEPAHYLERMDKLFLRGVPDKDGPSRQVIPAVDGVNLDEHFDEADFDPGDFNV